jgi:hypothetical protein
MAGAAAVGLGQLFDLSWQKSRYDALIATIRARAQAGDAVVMVNSDQFALLECYGPLDLPTWVVGNDALGGDAAQTLARFVADKARVWLVNYGWAMLLGRRSPIEEALATRGVRIAAEGFQDAALAQRFQAGLDAEGAASEIGNQVAQRGHPGWHLGLAGDQAGDHGDEGDADADRLEPQRGEPCAPAQRWVSALSGDHCAQFTST